MKKIIKNRVYDTDKALFLGETSCKTLYRKKTGEYFLYEESGKIIPLTYEEAQAWAEEHLDGDEYIAIFGEPEEDGSVEALNIRISSGRMTKLRQAASREGMSLVALVERLIDNL